MKFDKLKIEIHNFGLNTETGKQSYTGEVMNIKGIVVEASSIKEVFEELHTSLECHYNYINNIK